MKNLSERKIVSREWKTQYTEPGVGLVWFTATAEIHSLGGQHPYFSLTCWYKGARGYEGGGAAHEEIIARFPELKPFVKWHLCSTDGPLHYIANSLYWAGFLGYCNGKPNDPPNIEYLKSTCIYGALEDDQDYDIASMDKDQLKAWLEGRLDRLIDRFLAEMQVLFPDLTVEDRKV